MIVALLQGVGRVATAPPAAGPLIRGGVRRVGGASYHTGFLAPVIRTSAGPHASSAWRSAALYGGDSWVVRLGV